MIFKPAFIIGNNRDESGAGAAHVLRILRAKIATMNPRKDTFTYALTGRPGVGKTEITEIIASELIGNKDNEIFCVERISGVKVNVELISSWHEKRGMAPLAGAWKVKIIHEADRIPPAAQVAMLEMLDRILPGTAIMLTSNNDTAELQERFHTRFQFRNVIGPATEEITSLLAEHYPKIPRMTLQMIAVGSGGNVRAALHDAESEMDEHRADA
jgi:replication-associated recombination protein RarA